MKLISFVISGLFLALGAWTPLHAGDTPQEGTVKTAPTADKAGTVTPMTPTKKDKRPVLKATPAGNKATVTGHPAKTDKGLSPKAKRLLKLRQLKLKNKLGNAKKGGVNGDHKKHELYKKHLELKHKKFNAGDKKKNLHKKRRVKNKKGLKGMSGILKHLKRYPKEKQHLIIKEYNKHLKRMADIVRLEKIARKGKKTDLMKKVLELKKLENVRYGRALRKITGGKGKPVHPGKNKHVHPAKNKKH